MGVCASDKAADGTRDLVKQLGRNAIAVKEIVASGQEEGLG